MTRHSGDDRALGHRFGRRCPRPAALSGSGRRQSPGWRFTRRVIEQRAARQPALIDRRIADEEERQAERRRGQERRRQSAQWLIQYGLNRSHLDAVHTGDCGAAAKTGRYRPATRQQTRDAHRHVPACDRCRPDTALGLLEWTQSPRPAAG
ncbi:DUF6233 domain-containing protein [Streptomyces sp. NPDC038707]|uniref:DUF6233 domain-containing protein n=1 Tax=Streptomyces sp. NPDC038707 TaxID=3154329 RepID=UPI0033C08A54